MKKLTYTRFKKTPTGNRTRQVIFAAPKKRVVKPVAKKAASVTERLELLLRSLSALYPRDQVKPGLSVAYLPHSTAQFPAPGFYVSIVRYDGPAPRSQDDHQRLNGKQVLYNACESTLEGAVDDLLEQWADVTRLTRQLLNAVAR